MNYSFDNLNSFMQLPCATLMLLQSWKRLSISVKDGVFFLQRVKKENNQNSQEGFKPGDY